MQLPTVMRFVSRNTSLIAYYLFTRRNCCSEITTETPVELDCNPDGRKFMCFPVDKSPRPLVSLRIAPTRNFTTIPFRQTTKNGRSEHGRKRFDVVGRAETVPVRGSTGRTCLRGGGGSACGRTDFRRDARPEHRCGANRFDRRETPSVRCTVTAHTHANGRPQISYLHSCSIFPEILTAAPRVRSTTRDLRHRNVHATFAQTLGKCVCVSFLFAVVSDAAVGQHDDCAVP